MIRHVGGNLPPGSVPARYEVCSDALDNRLRMSPPRLHPSLECPSTPRGKRDECAAFELDGLFRRAV
jgi:hypothetical protein